MTDLQWTDNGPEEILWLDESPAHDFYEILEVSPRASDEVIKRAYRALIEKYHPDKHPAHRKAWAEGRTKQLNEAYATLRDPERRRAYHRSTRALDER